MIFKPHPLSAVLPAAELETDKTHCEKFGPCGVGKKAIYLNSFFLDRRYYIPLSSVRRVYKRLAMSKGGFTGRGLFATIPYLVVEYDNGKEKQCNFKYEEQVDQLLACLEREHPHIKLVSAAGEQRLAARERERAARKKPELSPQAQKSLRSLQDAADYLEKRPELSLELSQSAKRKRVYLCSNPNYRWVALTITLLGLAALVYGICLFARHGGFATYFTLFGLAAIFLFSSYNMLPTAHNNNNAIMKRADKAEATMAEYVKHYPHGAFPVKSWYAHPIVLKQMMDAVEEGRAVTVPEALEAVKARLRSLNADVQVEQEEYDEVVVIKALFLNHDYQ